MKIHLGQANGVCLTKWQMWALKHWTGAEAHVALGTLCGTAEAVPCYKANPCRPFSSRAGARWIFIFRKWCRPEFYWDPTHSAEKRGMDGARESTSKVKML
jgi:hypothetical protein